MEDSPTPASSPEIPAQEPDRRKFVQKTACIALGGAATLGPVAAGVTVLLNPLFKESQAGLKVRITSLDALPTGGAPQLFKVSAERKDGWTRHPLTDIGSVFIQRIGEGTTPADFIAFNATCPHLGCAVEFLQDSNEFSCPCHLSTFATTGEIKNAGSPSPRGLDSLEITIKDTEVWITYLNFKANITEKIAIV
jgi:Rieske Fe-S protein